jgi:hypothetical protein
MADAALLVALLLFTVFVGASGELAALWRSWRTRRRSSYGRPFPEVAEEDVDRIVIRDFDQSEIAAVRELLNSYGIERWHREPIRVRLAMLKLADGDATKLGRLAISANQDYRDVVVSAERPEYWTHALNSPHHAREKLTKEFFEKDLRQYEQWLGRDRGRNGG